MIISQVIWTLRFSLRHLEEKSNGTQEGSTRAPVLTTNNFKESKVKRRKSGKTYINSIPRVDEYDLEEDEDSRKW